MAKACSALCCEVKQRKIFFIRNTFKGEKEYVPFCIYHSNLLFGYKAMKNNFVVQGLKIAHGLSKLSHK
jgi:hypothetical protein